MCDPQAVVGGDSVLCDGFSVAVQLQREDPEAFQILTTTPRPFEYVDPGGVRPVSLRRTHVPIQVDPLTGEIIAVSFNNRSAAPPVDLPSDQVEPFYHAWQQFGRLLAAPEGQVRLRLEAGDILVVANHRVLHSRTAFPSDSPRRLQGCYIDMDQVRGRVRATERAADAAVDLRRHQADVSAELRALYADDEEYDGALSMLTHSLQAALQAQRAGADEQTVVGALLHDVGWKLARTAPWLQADGQGDAWRGDEKLNAPASVPEDSVAAREGILAFCGNGEADLEAQQAQHDVIGATFLRMRGLHETVACGTL